MKIDDLISRLDKVAPPTAKPKTKAQLQTEEQEAAAWNRWFSLAMRDGEYAKLNTDLPLSPSERREMNRLYKRLPKYPVDGIDCVESNGYLRPDSR